MRLNQVNFMEDSSQEGFRTLAVPKNGRRRMELG